METYQFMEKTSREIKEYLRNGGDLVYLPIGSIERYGPHLPLACKCHVAGAISNMLAGMTHGYCLPVVSFSVLNNTHVRKGNIGIDFKILHKMVYNICKELISNGFRRIILVGDCGELYYTVNEFFEAENVALVRISPRNILADLSKEEIDETSFISACLKLNGKEDILEKVIKSNESLYEKVSVRNTKPSPGEMLNHIGRVGYEYGADEYQVLPVKEIRYEKAVVEIQNWAKSKIPSIEALKEYNSFLERAGYDRILR